MWCRRTLTNTILRYSGNDKEMIPFTNRRNFVALTRLLGKNYANNPFLAPDVTSKKLRPNSPPNSNAASPIVFNRHNKRLQRDRATLLPQPQQYDYLRDEVAEQLADRLLDIKRTFPILLDLGSGSGHVAKFIDPETSNCIIQMELSEKLLKRDLKKDEHDQKNSEVSVLNVHADEEFIPFSNHSVDGVVSCLSLHWVNDLPGTFSQVHNVLKPDCPFIGAMFGGDTLFELRSSLVLAQQEREGGVSPHISPFVDIRDLSGLLNDAAFNLTTIDVDTIVVNYPSPFELFADLRGMGETNSIANRLLNLKKDTLLAAISAYKSIYGNEDGSIPATFQIYNFIGWSYSENQPKPLRPGSAKVSFKDVL